MEKLSLGGRYLPSGPVRKNSQGIGTEADESVACTALNQFHLLQFPMVWCSLLFKGPGSRSSWRKHMILRLGQSKYMMSLEYLTVLETKAIPTEC